MSNWTAYSCHRCGATRPASTGQGAAAHYACAACGLEALDIQMKPPESQWSGSTVHSMWRYAALLPVNAPEPTSGPLHSVGWTPFHAAPRAATRVGAAEVWVKDDGALPTGSLKDRASAVVVMRAKELGVGRIITASTGNAGVALAAMARAADLEAVVLVPAAAPPAKIAQLMVFGARLVLVDGNYDDAFRLSRAAADALGWYCRNTAYNPFTVEGKKTAAFEVCEQFALSQGRSGFEAPDAIYVSVGDGNIITGLHKGITDLVDAGWLDKKPRLIGIQAEGCAAIAKAFDAKADVVAPVVSNTIADSIAADQPADGLRALRAVRDTGGHLTVVPDKAILEAIPTLGIDAAVFAEPAAATAYAGLIADAQAGRVKPTDRIVVMVTGNGLKDVGAAIKATETPRSIPPNLDALLAALDSA